MKLLRFLIKVVVKKKGRKKTEFFSGIMEKKKHSGSNEII